MMPRGLLEREIGAQTALAKISRIISSSPDLDQVYERFVRALREIISFDRATISVVVDRRGVLRDAYVWGVEVRGRRSVDAWERPGTISQEAIRGRSPVLVSATGRHDLVTQYPGEAAGYDAGLRSFMATPLVASEAVIGTLNVSCTEVNAYAGRDVDVVECVSTQIAGAISNALLLEQRMHAKADLHRKNERLEHAIEELRTSQRQIIRDERICALQQMASGIAHNLNNKLTPILGFSELLLHRASSHGEGDSHRRYLEMIRASAEDAARVVRGIREFVRPIDTAETGRSVDVPALVREALSLASPESRSEANAPGVTIDVSTDLRECLPLRGEGSSLREGLVNMFHNAVDSMPRGGTICASTYSDGSEVHIEVSDTGEGMTEDVKQRCLEPFFTTRGPGAAGMGLTIVSGVVRRHRGRLEITSAPNEGTKVLISLPAQSVSDDSP